MHTRMGPKTKTPGTEVPGVSMRWTGKLPGSDLSPFTLPMRPRVSSNPDIFRISRWRSFELPRISNPSVELVVNFQVAPKLRSSCFTDFRVCELPRIPHLPAPPQASYQVTLAPRLWLHRLMDFRVSPNLTPSGCSVHTDFGLPRVLHRRLG